MTVNQLYIIKKSIWHKWSHFNMAPVQFFQLKLTNKNVIDGCCSFFINIVDNMHIFNRNNSVEMKESNNHLYIIHKKMGLMYRVWLVRNDLFYLKKIDVFIRDCSCRWKWNKCHLTMKWSSLMKITSACIELFIHFQFST